MRGPSNPGMDSNSQYCFASAATPAMSAVTAGRITIYWSTVPASRVRGRSLLRPIGRPALVDQVRMNIVDIVLAQDVIEALHARRREHSLQHDVLECRMQAVVEFAQVGRGAGSERVAARTFFDELDFAGIDLRFGGGCRRRFRKALLDARCRRRYGAAAQLEGDDAVGVLIFERRAA